MSSMAIIMNRLGEAAVPTIAGAIAGPVKAVAGSLLTPAGAAEVVTYIANLLSPVSPAQDVSRSGRRYVSLLLVPIPNSTEVMVLQTYALSAALQEICCGLEAGYTFAQPEPSYVGRAGCICSCSCTQLRAVARRHGLADRYQPG